MNIVELVILKSLLFLLKFMLLDFIIKNTFMCLFVCFPQTPAEGATTVLFAALSPALEGGDCGGGYWVNGHREMTTPPSFDPQLQLSLWETSVQLLGLQ